VYSTGRGDPGRIVNTGSPFLHFTDQNFIQFAGFNQCFGSGFRSGSRFRIRIRIQKGKITHKSRKNLEISCFEVLDVLF
jgi:hypothetical protein